MKFERAAATLVLVFGIAGAALAHSGATGIVKQRMDKMGEVASQMKVIARMLNGRLEFDPAVMEASATEIADHASGFEPLFPEGSVSPPSEARPRIWTRWDDFRDQFATMEVRAGSLADQAASAQDPSDLKNAFVRLGNTCKSCHQDFRQQK
ncbi:MAG: cytochrome c [Hoeflea sp.]|uniref:c-type cytochrome n=1 Tax=Hoeflea sp. TaxID=1940281 RepID=UPI0032EE78CD